MKKMQSLIKINVEQNKEKFRQEIEIEEEEQRLKEKSIKKPKYKKKLEKFQAEKAERIKAIYAKNKRFNDTILTDMTKAEIEDANKNDAPLVNDSRLKSYNL